MNFFRWEQVPAMEIREKEKRREENRERIGNGERNRAIKNKLIVALLVTI